ncbi:MAG: sterol desaturase family protein, partial [Gammaproteobacteria bacterium]|nr:sterol desaturase family protein [Gammaproteobacteria bacterium]
RLHHSMTRMYGFNGFMRHPTNQLLEFAPGALPLLFLGINLEVAFLVVFAVTVQLLLQHSNVDYRAGVFRYLIAVNEVHRLHHLRNTAGEEGVNYSLFFTLWDMALGSFRLPKSDRMLTSDDIGLRPNVGRN